MKNYKRELNTFAYYDVEGMAARFEKRAAEGWILTASPGSTITYRKGQPEKLHYAVTYFPDRKKNIGFLPEEQAFIDMCAATGWRHLPSAGTLQVFYTQAENPVPFDSDSAVQLEVIHDNMIRSYLPGRGIIALLILMNMLRGISRAMKDPLYTLSSWGALAVIVAAVMLLLVFSAEVIRYYIWYYRQKVRVESGGNLLPLKGNPDILRWAVIILLIVSLVDVTGLFRAATQQRQPVRVVENYVDDLDFEVYDDSLPLYIEDIVPEIENSDVFTYECTNDSTFLLTVIKCLQAPDPDNNHLPMLRYNIIRPSGEKVYNLCLNSLLTEYDMYDKYFEEGEGYEYVPVSARKWCADKAWKLTGGSKNLHEYIVCYDDWLVKIMTDIELDRNMQHIFAEKMGEI